MNKRQTGTRMEEVAARWLVSRGYRILARQYRTPYGEVDLIVLEGQTLVFTEVKYRGSDRCGSPAEAVNWQKQRHLIRSGLWYCQKEQISPDRPVRFDVIELIRRDGQLQIRQIQNAFEARG